MNKAQFAWHFDKPCDCIPKGVPVAAIPIWEAERLGKRFVQLDGIADTAQVHFDEFATGHVGKELVQSKFSILV